MRSIAHLLQQVLEEAGAEDSAGTSERNRAEHEEEPGGEGPAGQAHLFANAKAQA